jgi:hypothetical protein
MFTHHKFVAVMLLTLTLFAGCGTSEPPTVDAEAEHRPLGDGECRACVFEDGPASIDGFRASTHSYLREDRFVVVLENVRGDGAVPVFDVGRNIAAILYGCSYDLPE